MAHLVSKEIFLNLRPEGSNIPMTVPEYSCIHSLAVFSTPEVYWSKVEVYCVPEEEGGKL